MRDTGYRGMKLPFASEDATGITHFRPFLNFC